MNDISQYIPGILLAYTAFLLTIASPGPNILAIIGTSMEKGRKSGKALAIGVALGSLCWGTLTALGLSALLATYAFLLTGIKIGGGLFLLWLAYKSFKSARSSHDLEAKVLSGDQRRPMDYFYRGFIIQMTNPKAALAWVAITSLGLTPGAPIWVVIVIVGGIFLFSMAIHILYAVAFSTPVMVRMYGKARRTIQTTLGVFFTFAGIKLLTSRA